MGTATIRQGETKVEVFATLFDDLGAVFPFPDQTYRWGGSFEGAIDEGELSEGGATFRFHDATEGEASIVRLPGDHQKGKFRGTGKLRSLY
jgi:hypothetical protein